MKKVQIFSTLVVFMLLTGVTIQETQAQDSIKELEKRLKILKEKKIKEKKSNQLIIERTIIFNKIKKIQTNIDEIQNILDEISENFKKKISHKQKVGQSTNVQSNIMKYNFKGNLCDRNNVDIMFIADFTKKEFTIKSRTGKSSSGLTPVRGNLISREKENEFDFNIYVNIRGRMIEFTGYVTPSGGRAKLWLAEFFCGTNENKMEIISN